MISNTSFSGLLHGILEILTIHISRVSRYLLPVAVCLLTQVSFSQTISGNISNQDDQPVPYANVLLMRESDSTLIKGVITDETGNFEIQVTSPGIHYLKVSLLGYDDYLSEPFEVTRGTDLTLPGIRLKAGIALEEVTVSGTRPLFEKKSDKLIINVQSSEVAVGSSASEILGRSPGVLLNTQSNAITINGRTGVNIMINGRMLNLPPENIVSYLQGINANNIENIEILTSPPANVDAQGNAGFINIILREGGNDGIDGAISLAAGVGTGLFTNDNFSLNFRKGKWSITSFYNLYYDERDQNVLSNRSVLDNNDLINYSTSSIRYPADPNNAFNLALDFNSDRFDFGGFINANTKRWVMDATNLFIAERNGTREQQILNLNYERNQNDRIHVNSYLSYSFSNASRLDFNINFINLMADNPTTYNYQYFDSAMNLTQEEFFENFSNTETNVITVAVDQHFTFGEKLNLDLGAKITNNEFVNDFEINELINGQLIQDPGLSNVSSMDEYVYAGYFNLDYNPNEKLNLRGGLRYEYTDSELTDILTGPVVDRMYGNFFPSLSVNYEVNERVNLGVSYNERINRPNFLNLAPFFIFLDPDTFITGNPSTQPSTARNLDISYSIGDRSLSLSYNYTNDPIANFTERYDEVNDRNFFITENLDYSRLVQVSAIIPLQLTAKIKLQNTFIYQYNEIKDNPDNFGRIYRSNSIDVNSVLSFNVNENVSAEVIYNFFGPKYWGGVNFFNSYHSMDLSIQKKLGDKMGTIGFKLLDVFNDWFFDFTSDYPEINYSSRNMWDLSHTTWQLTYVLNFGQSQKERKQRKTGAEEDLKRFQN